MKDIDTRTLQVAEYLVYNKSTIRKTAKYFGISKSTVHNDLSKRLKKLNFALYKNVRQILNINFKEKYIRGGIATKNKYANSSQKQKKVIT